MPAFVHFIDKNEKKFCFRLEGSVCMADSPVGLEVSNRPLSYDWPQLFFADEFGVWKVGDYSGKGMTLNGVASGGGLLAGGEFITVGKYNLLFEMRFDTDEEREVYEGARRKIDEHHETEAEYELGVQYLHGEGVAQDFSKAKALFESADEKHHPDAAYQLGTMYMLGVGVDKDLKTGLELLMRAAGQGNFDSMEILAAFFEHDGEPEMAYIYYRLKADLDQDDWQSKVGRDRTYDLMTTEQLDEARELVDMYKKMIVNRTDRWLVG